jgi:hypothetical protein
MRKIIEISGLETRDDVLHGIAELRKAIDDALSNAESCETLSDLVDNITDAQAAASELVHLQRAATALYYAELRGLKNED